jgi:aryl-alcohol dehydrogenase-like predicted oxidoreductase
MSDEKPNGVAPTGRDSKTQGEALGRAVMQPRPLAKTGLTVTPIGFGAFKIGRNEKTKYAEGYPLPDEQTVAHLLNGILDLGITYIDTAPAYGLSEERIGRAIGHRRKEFTLSTKVGETFENGQSQYDYSAAAVRSSVERSLRRLQADVVDLVFIHSNGNDLAIQQSTDAVATLRQLKHQGLVRAIGLSGKTVEGARLALDWADAIMVEYHLDDPSHAGVIATAAERGVAVIVKKGLASGKLPPAEAIGFVLGNAGVSSLVVGGLNLDHIRSNVAIATQWSIRSYIGGAGPQAIPSP